MKNKTHQITATFIVLLFLFACNRDYSFQLYSFPPESEMHENNWTYICKIIDWAPFGKNIPAKGKRKLQIIVTDKNKKSVLRDEFEIEGASIRSKIQWSKIEYLTLTLYEQGNEFSEDDYNKQLIKTGPKHIMTLNYIWDGEKYMRSSTEQAAPLDRE